MLKSLRSTLIVASIFWTAGLLGIMHMISIVALHVIPSVRTSDPTWPIAVSILFMAIGVLTIRQVLAPFRRLRERLAWVRAGTVSRIEGDHPTEVQPLINDLNSLLEDREQAVKRALATAGDLAHGLKTPLALLIQEAGRVEAEGNPGLAANILQQIDRMSRQVNYHLARARAAASGAAGAAPLSVSDSAHALVRTVTKLYASRTLDISVAIEPHLRARVQREDLDEMLGNLLDNACKWARSKVSIAGDAAGFSVTLTVDDDGPGLAQALRTAVLERGVRADEAAPGSGLGLAIVRDLAELYGGSIALVDSPLGGLRARLTLPAK